VIDSSGGSYWYSSKCFEIRFESNLGFSKETDPSANFRIARDPPVRRPLKAPAPCVTLMDGHAPGRNQLVRMKAYSQEGLFMSTEISKALVRREYEDGVNQKDFGIRDEVLAENYVAHFPGVPPLQGIEAFRQFTSGFFDAFPDLQTTIEDLIAEGDKVAIRQTWHGTHKGNFLGIPPTGKRVSFTSTEFYRVANDVLAEEWIELDMLGLLQQLGAIPSMG